jgi:glycosyltransferase involved in cell wall biosynthesis
MNALEGRGLGLGAMLTPLHRSLLKSLAKGAVAVDCVSPAMAGHLVSRLDLSQDKVTVIDNAVNTERFQPRSVSAARAALGLDRYDPLVGYVGQRPHELGASQLVEIAPRLAAKHPNLGVVVLGDGEGLATLKARAAELGVADRCVFTGTVPFVDVPTWVNALDVGVSFRDPQSQSASELKVRQYVACGKPVVATFPGANGFLTENNLGSLVRFDDLVGVEGEVDRWLSLSGEGRSEFATRAASYAAAHLSVVQSVEDRLALWASHLS